MMLLSHNPMDLANLLEFECNTIFNNYDIRETDNHTPENVEDTYLQIEIFMY